MSCRLGAQADRPSAGTRRRAAKFDPHFAGASFVPVWKILTVVLVLAIALLATSASASPPDRSPMYSFCDGRLVQISAVRPCPDGSLRIIR